MEFWLSKLGLTPRLIRHVHPNWPQIAPSGMMLTRTTAKLYHVVHLTAVAECAFVKGSPGERKTKILGVGFGFEEKSGFVLVRARKPPIDAHGQNLTTMLLLPASLEQALQLPGHDGAWQEEQDNGSCGKGVEEYGVGPDDGKHA
eukprot:1159428-Pelagomonas_calceolata.AAC.2